MKVIVVGAGEVGTYVAERLNRQHDVSLMEKNQERFNQIERDNSLDVLTILGSGTDPDALKRAGVEEADLLVAVTKNDDANLLAALLAKQAGVKRTVVRVESRGLRNKEVGQLLGSPENHLMIDPDEEVAQDVLRLMEYPGALDMIHMAGGEVVIIGSRLPADAPLVGVSLKELGEELEPDWDFMVATITRQMTEDEEVTVIPRENETLQEGDLLRIICKQRSLRDVIRRLGIERDMPARALLLGGGRTAQLLAESLVKKAVDVAIIEKNLDRANELSASLKHALIFNGDITDVDMLEEADVRRQDIVVALTGEDDANVLACLYAKSAGSRSNGNLENASTPKTIAVVHRLKLLGLLDTHDVGATLSPRTATANSVLRFVRSGDATQIATFLQGDAEILEFAVTDESACEGKKISAAGFPKEALVGAILRDGKPQIARGSTVFRDRDHVIVIAKSEWAESIGQLF